MPAKELMGWNADQRRWFKRYRGDLYAVSARQLKCPPTKDASRAAANAWWEAKQAELDFTPEPPPPTYLQSRQKQMVSWLRANGEQDAADRMEAMEQARINEDFASQLADEIVLHELGIDAEGLKEKAVWEDRLTNRNGHVAPPNRQISTHVKSFLDHKETQYLGNKLSAGRWAAIKAHLQAFSAWVGADQAIDVLNSAKVLDLYNYLLKTDEYSSGYYKRDIFITSKQFIEHLVQLDLIPMPGNLRSKSLTFAKKKRTIETFTLPELKKIRAAAEERTQLFVLLAMNCGFTQTDVSDLTHEEVDWKKGRIKRQRSKTRGKKNVPTVDYPLWAETLRLLKQHATTAKSEFVLMTGNETPLRQESVVDGKYSKTDNVDSAFTTVLNKLNWPKPRKTFTDIRNTSSSLFDDHKEFSRYAQYFLGHAPSNTADSHYVVPSQRRFNLAVEWLGKKYGTS